MEQVVWLGVWMHAGGTEVHVGETAGDIVTYRDHLARAHWAERLPDVPLPERHVGVEYFARLRGSGETFEVRLGHAHLVPQEHDA